MAEKTKNAASNAKAAARVRAAQQQKRQRMQWSIGIIALVIVGIVVLVLAKSSKSGTTPSTSESAKPAPASIAKNLAAVPIDAIAAAKKAIPSSNPVVPITTTKLTKSGKPEVLYIGAEFCPYCAGERWALVVALSKFGTFENLKVINSSESDIPTLSFVGSTYKSPYLTFDGIELLDQNHNPLESATAEQQKLFSDTKLRGAQSANSFPFIDFGGRFMQNGGSVDASTLVGKSQTDIAKALAGSTKADTDKTSMEGNINSVAGGFIESMCDLTKNQPVGVCKAITTS